MSLPAIEALPHIQFLVLGHLIVTHGPVPECVVDPHLPPQYTVLLPYLPLPRLEFHSLLLHQFQMVYHFQPGSPDVLLVLLRQVAAHSLHVFLGDSVSELIEIVDLPVQVRLELLGLGVYLGEGVSLPFGEAIAHLDSLALD